MISILKNILIAVILFLIATSIILIVFSVRDNKNEPRRERAADGQPESPPAAAAESPAAGEQAAAAEQTPKTQRATDTEQAAATQPSVPEETAQPAPSGITGLAAASPDGGLFSTRSGLGWESYLEQRLDSELKRAASFDQDLSCVAFACDDSCDDSDYHNAAQRILETFMFKDLAFEYGKNGFVVILPNIDLDQALVKVEGFIKRIEEIPHSLLLHAGISSRNGRLMHANLLLKEAVRGLEKARCEGENRIIAFRTDPARFRQFIAAKD